MSPLPFAFLAHFGILFFTFVYGGEIEVGDNFYEEGDLDSEVELDDESTFLHYKHPHDEVPEGYKLVGDTIVPKHSGGIGTYAARTADDLWPKGQIPYRLDSTMQSYRELIRSAMLYYETHTCVRFIRANNNHKNVVLFTAGRGCSSMVGPQSKRGEQKTILGAGCIHFGTILHELGHVIGLHHEHNRGDRDEHVKIHFRHLKDNKTEEFQVLEGYEHDKLTDYDYSSIMHYGEYAYSRGTGKTIVPKNSKNKIYQPKDRKEISELDKKAINKMYDCNPDDEEGEEGEGGKEEDEEVET